MIAAWAQTTDAGGADFSTPLIGLIIIVGLIAAAILLSSHAGRLRPRMRSAFYTGGIIAAFVLWFAADSLAIGIPGGVFLAIFAALLAARIVVELSAPSPSARRHPYRVSTGQSDGGGGSYSPGHSGSGGRRLDEPGSDGHGGGGD